MLKEIKDSIQAAINFLSLTHSNFERKRVLEDIIGMLGKEPSTENEREWLRRTIIEIESSNVISPEDIKLYERLIPDLRNSINNF